MRYLDNQHHININNCFRRIMYINMVCSITGAEIINRQVLKDIDFQDCKSLSSSNFSGKEFHNCTFEYAEIGDTNFTNSKFIGSDFHNTNGRNSIFKNAIFKGTNLRQVDFSRSNFSNAKFESDYEISDSDFSNSNLQGATMSGLVMDMIDFTNAYLKSVDLHDSQLEGATLTGANLNEANLTGANFEGANLTRANLTGANLSDGEFPETDFTGANLAGANLSSGNFTGANFTGANLTGAICTEADFFGATFTEAILTGVINFDNEDDEDDEDDEGDEGDEGDEDDEDDADDEDDGGESLLAQITQITPFQLQEHEIQTIDNIFSDIVFDISQAIEIPASEIDHSEDNVIFYIDNQRVGILYPREQLIRAYNDRSSIYVACKEFCYSAVPISKVETYRLFVRINLTTTVFVNILEMMHLLATNHKEWHIKLTDMNEPLTASILNVYPQNTPGRNLFNQRIDIVSGDHCQNGTDRKLSFLTPIRFITSSNTGGCKKINRKSVGLKSKINRNGRTMKTTRLIKNKMSTKKGKFTKKKRRLTKNKINKKGRLTKNKINKKSRLTKKR